MSEFWEVFLAVVAGWFATRVFGNWLFNKVLRTAEKSDRLKVEGADRIAKAVVAEMRRGERP